MPARGDDDDTVIQRRLPPRRRRRWPLVTGLIVVVVAAGGTGAALHLWWRPPPPQQNALLQQPDPAPADPLPADPGPAVAPLPTETEAEINAEHPTDLTVVRFALNPTIVVMDFASLAHQGEMLNRVAALVEKSGLPRNRVLTDSELSAAIRASGTTPETFYYGHDYRAADIARFFALADHDHIALNAGEEALRRLADQQGWLKPGAVGAVISLPALGSDPLIDAQARATILHHELSHGEYFTNPVYAAYTRHFWQDVLSERERLQFRKFLAEDGYDSGIEDLMMNEMQAYLMHTRDPRFFTARAVGIAQDRLTLLQAQFLLGMPPGWLRDCTTVPTQASK